MIDEQLPDNATADWERMIAALERQAPVWEPGTKQGYHAVTFGFLVGEVVRRASGASSLGAFLHDEIAAPLGVDFFVGTPESEDHRVADLVREPMAVTSELAPTAAGTPDDPWLESMRDRMAAMASPDSLAGRSLGLASPPLAPGNNERAWRAAEIPGANGHGNARALATVYGALARGGESGGVRLLSGEAVKRAAAEQVRSPDAVLLMETRRSLGFMLPVPGQPDRRGPNAFGHAGAGGSLGYADPDRAFGFGYTMNRMWGGTFMQPDPRAQGLVTAVHEALDA